MLFDPGCSNCGCPAACSPCMPPAVDLWVTSRLSLSGPVFYDGPLPYIGGNVWQSSCYMSAAFRLACNAGFLVWQRTTWNAPCTVSSGTAQLYPVGGGWQVVTLRCDPFLLVVRPQSSPAGFGDHHTVTA